MRSKPPTQENLIALMYFVEGSTEAAQYLRKRVRENFKLNGLLEENKGLLDGLDDFCRDVSLQDTVTVEVWAGQPIPDKKENIYLLKAQELSVGENQLAHQDVSVRFYIGDDVSFNRDYGAKDGEVDESTREQMDSFIHAWFLSQDLARSSGVIYALNDEGTAYDKVINPSTLEHKIDDPQTGFAAYVKENSKGKIQIPFLETILPERQEPGVDKQ